MLEPGVAASVRPVDYGGDRCGAASGPGQLAIGTRRGMAVDRLKCLPGLVVGRDLLCDA